MPVLVNFKVCDNAKECGGVAICPTGAITFDEKKETLVIDNSKCISCGQCENECPIGAIRVAKDENEYKKIKEEIENDPRKTKDLFVDRYGAPLSEFFMLEAEKIEQKIDTNKIVLVELYNDDSIQCLLKSIPIKELVKDLPDTTTFYKIESKEDIEEKYEVKELPTLLVFNKGKLSGKIEGYYTDESKNEIIDKIKSMIK